MTEFKEQNLAGSRFDDVSLQGAVFHNVNLAEARFDDINLRDVRFENANLSGAQFANVNLNGAKISAVMIGAAIDGDIRDLTIWGVEVMPLIDAELNRRHPGREKMRPANAAGYREAWELLERLWAETVEKARALPPDMLHESVNGEWSFIETQRHLVFATDAWVRRAVLGDPSPWDPLDLPHDEMYEEPSIPRDRAVRPSLDEVLALRADRMGTVRDLFAELTDERLTKMTVPVMEPGYPASESYLVSDCLTCILGEEWEHRMYVARDLAVLVGGQT